MIELTGPILTFDDLCRLADFQQPLQRPSAVARWLKRQKVPFRRDAKGRPFTTMALMFPDERIRVESSGPDWSALDLTSAAKKARSLGRRHSRADHARHHRDDV